MSLDDVRARLLATTAGEPAATRDVHRRRVLLFQLAGGAVATALFFALGGIDRGSRPIELVSFASGLAFFFAVVLTRLTAGKSGSMLGHSRMVLLGSIAIAPVLALAALTVAHVWPESADESVPRSGAIGCAALTFLQGVLPLIILLIPLRGSDPVHPTSTGIAVGMAAGVWSTAMAYLRCPHVAPSHTIVAHVLPTLIFTMAGAVIGRSMLRLR